MENPSRVPSPCVRNCCLNDDDICLGCFRSIEEITQWSAADDEQRRQFLINAAQRREQHQKKWHF